MSTAVATIEHTNAAAAAFDLLQRQGKMLASAAIIPDIYRGKVADCALISEIAGRIGASPVLVANNLDVIHGRPSWRSQFLIACVNQSGKFSSLRYEFDGEGKSRKCRAYAIERSTNERLDGSWISWQMAESEGWTKKAGSKWLTMPDQMFIYRAAAFWTRAYAPEIALGFPTDDETRDVIDITPLQPAATIASVADLNASLSVAPNEQPDAMTYADLADMINGSDTPEELDYVRSLLTRVPGQAQQAELATLIIERAKAL